MELSTQTQLGLSFPQTGGYSDVSPGNGGPTFVTVLTLLPAHTNFLLFHWALKEFSGAKDYTKTCVLGLGENLLSY